MGYDIFMSYTHVKDFNGAVGLFVEHLEPELYKKSGVIISVFHDKKDIKIGDEWKKFISAQLQSAKILLVLLSPTWLHSPECKWEYKEFLASMKPTTKKKIISLIWDPLENAILDAPHKKLLGEIKKYQLLDWTSHQYDDFKVRDQQAALGELAGQLVAQLKEI
jgi:hypothetical protein